VLKRGVCVALLICGWSLDASASVSINPSPLDAGTALVGQPTSATGTLSSTTNVHVDLTVTNSCTGTGAGVFELSATSNINLNAPAMITVTYTPTQRGSRTCRVDVFDTGTTTLLGSFNVRGTGESPPVMSVSVSGNSTNFGSLRWNNAAPNHTFSRGFTVSNGGDQTLDVTVAISGANMADFTITAGGTAGSVAPGGARTWTITFDPSAAGNRAATITFSGNDPDMPSTAFALSGVGTNAVISAPATLQDFGIINAGSTSPLDITITNNGAAPKGNLGVTSATIADPNNSGWFSFGGSCSGASCTFSPALSIATTGIATVRCSPPAAATAGMAQTATVTFTSDSDIATGNTASLRCTAGKSSLATNLSVVTFAPSLVSTTTSANTVTISNTGNVATTYYLTKSGLNQMQFDITTPTGCGTSSTNQCPIAAMGTSMFSVTFSPNLEGDISAGVTIVPMGSSNVQVTLTGRGIDRHIQMIDALQFPDTFRNPGDTATVMPIAVKNIGEYPLKVLAVQLDGAPNWELVDPPQPFEVPGLGSVDINVRFKPVAAGKAPEGQLRVTHDDTKTTLPNVILSGNGKDRNVAMPGPIDFGNSGAGVPVKLTQIKTQAEWLTVLNMDDTTFKIREITFDMPEVFKVETLGGDTISNRDLTAGGSEQFEVIFLPPKAGDYTANMTLFLDQDPESQRTIQVHGNALFVDAHGGGGCSTGNGAGAGALLVLGVLVRRKRRRA
jgi:hypothetical protein